MLKRFKYLAQKQRTANKSRRQKRNRHEKERSHILKLPDSVMAGFPSPNLTLVKTLGYRVLLALSRADD